MPRIINLSNASECSLNDPYFRVTAAIRERYQYEWIEQILINELSIFPVKGRTYTISFEHSPTLSDLFNVVGLLRNNTLWFSDQVTLSDSYASYIQRYAFSYCAAYVDRVEADGGEVVDETGTCSAFGYFSPSTPTSGYSYTFTEGITAGDVFNLMGVTGQINLTFTEDLLILDVFNTDITSGVFLSFVDFVNILVVDGLSIDTDTNKKLIFSEAITTAEVNERFTQRDGGTYRLTFEDVVGVLTFESVITNVKKSFTFAFMDDIGPAETFSSQQSRNFTLSFTEQLDLSASN